MGVVSPCWSAMNEGRMHPMAPSKVNLVRIPAAPANLQIALDQLMKRKKLPQLAQLKDMG